MNISLDQAIEIHARVLMHRVDGDAPSKARERAADLRRVGDEEGWNVWISVADAAERLLNEGRVAIPAKAKSVQ